MSGGSYTRRQMDAARTQPDAGDERTRDPREGAESLPTQALEPRQPTDPRIDALHAEATQSIGYTANTLRSVRERYRTARS